jgi:hypothetical protein
MVAVSEGPYRAIHHLTAPDEFELYDRARDPLESRNVAQELPEAAARLRARADAYAADAGPPWEGETPEVELDDLTLRQLRALGYKVD